MACDVSKWRDVCTCNVPGHEMVLVSGSNSCGVEDHTANLQAETEIPLQCKTINIRAKKKKKTLTLLISMSNALNELKSLTLSYCSN